jgi:hypothetical protein
MARRQRTEPSISELIERVRVAAGAVRASHRQLYGEGLPYDLFPAHWAFVGPTDLSRDEFEARIHQTYAEWDAEDPDPDAHTWNPNEVVLCCGRVLILYPAAPGGPGANVRVADLRADGEYFTAGELMYKFYRAAAADLAGGDRQGFQGFEFVAIVGGYGGPLPLYQAWLG